MYVVEKFIHVTHVQTYVKRRTRVPHIKAHVFDMSVIHNDAKYVFI